MKKRVKTVQCAGPPTLYVSQAWVAFMSDGNGRPAFVTTMPLIPSTAPLFSYDLRRAILFEGWPRVEAASEDLAGFPMSYAPLVSAAELVFGETSEQ